MSLLSTRPPFVGPFGPFGPFGPLGRSSDRAERRADLIAGALALVLVAAATAVGFLGDVRLFGSDGFPGAPATFGEWPVLGEWLPHIGPGTPLAVLVAVATVAWAPGLAQRLSWRRALTSAYLLAVVWTFSLALVDGWRRGVAHQLTTRDEYLSQVPGITDIPTMLRTFSARILDFAPDSWTTHVSAHPPGATLIFVWLDRVGLSAGAWAGVCCVLVAAASAVAVPVTISALGRTDLARAAMPFVALLPGAVWMGVSADGMFAGVVATGVALLAVGARAGGAVPACLAGGVLLGFGIYLSYGLILMSAIAVAVVLVLRSWRALALSVAGALTVAGTFTAAGFWWPDGYHLVIQRYYQGIANDRPYAYWVWANLACLALAVGPAAFAGLRRAVRHFGAGLPGLPVPGTVPVIALVRGAAAAVLTADLSGLSKAEVERIWLPFAVWLVVAAALLPAPSRRWWLAAQAATAIAVNHILLTNW